MSWICNKCETENSDEHDICEVCDAQAPYITDFVYDKVLSDGTPIKLSWGSKFCDKTVLVYAGMEEDVTGKNSYEIKNPVDTFVKFLLSNDVVDNKSKRFKLKFFPKPHVNISSNKQKIIKGKKEEVIIKWSIKDALSAVFFEDDNYFKIGKRGTKIVSPKESVTYTIEAIALDGKTKHVESLQIHVFDESEISFVSDKYFIFLTVPVTLSWQVKNAKKVLLDTEDVGMEGKKVVEPMPPQTYVLSVEDEFGVKERKIDIQMLPIPQVKSIMSPMPNIVSNMSVNIKQPRFKVDIKFPTIDIGWIKAEVPRVKSFSDLGLNVEFSPSLPKFGLLNSIKRMYNDITRKWIWKK